MYYKILEAKSFILFAFILINLGIFWYLKYRWGNELFVNFTNDNFSFLSLFLTKEHWQIKTHWYMYNSWMPSKWITLMAWIGSCINILILIIDIIFRLPEDSSFKLTHLLGLVLILPFLIFCFIVWFPIIIVCLILLIFTIVLIKRSFFNKNIEVN